MTSVDPFSIFPLRAFYSDCVFLANHLAVFIVKASYIKANKLTKILSDRILPIFFVSKPYNMGTVGLPWTQVVKI